MKLHTDQGYTFESDLFQEVCKLLECEAAGVPEYISSLQTQLVKCYAIARENLKAAAQRQIKYHDTCIMQNPFQPRQLALKRSSGN